MNSKLLYNQIKEQLPPMEGVAVKVEDNKMNFYIACKEKVNRKTKKS